MIVGTYGTWSYDEVSNVTSDCPETSGGATIDGWVQVDRGNEYAMMQAVSNQPIVVSIASGPLDNFAASGLVGSLASCIFVVWMSQQ